MKSAPNRGDFVWLSFDPQAGHEQAGTRPALVLSPLAYNQRIGLALVCTITSQGKGYPFEVKIPEGSDIHGFVLADQLKSVDWRARVFRPAGTAPHTVVKETIKKFATLLQ